MDRSGTLSRAAFSYIIKLDRLAVMVALINMRRSGCRALSSLTATRSQGPPLAHKRKVLAYNIKAPVPYIPSWKLQQDLMAQRIAWQKEGREGFDVLLLLEHPSVYTLGRSSKVEDVKFCLDENPDKHEVHRIDRGGKVTWHGPGQVVLYPILDLNFHKKDLRWYVGQLEETVIQVLAKYGIQAGRDVEHTGVWVDDAKVAAIGMNASRWVTIHGLSLNVNPDLQAFERIVPCGIQDRRVTSISQLLSTPVDKELVRERMLQTFHQLFPAIDLRVIDTDSAPSLEKCVTDAQEDIM